MRMCLFFVHSLFMSRFYVKVHFMIEFNIYYKGRQDTVLRMIRPNDKSPNRRVMLHTNELFVVRHLLLSNVISLCVRFSKSGLLCISIYPPS